MGFLRRRPLPPHDLRHLPAPPIGSQGFDVASPLIDKQQAQQLVGRAEQLLGAAETVWAAPFAARGPARDAIRSMSAQMVSEQMASVPVRRLRETTGGRVRLGPIEAAGFRTAAEVLWAGRARLEAIPGVGPKTAMQVLGAAAALRRSMEEHVRPRFDLTHRTYSQTEALLAIARVERADHLAGPAVIVAGQVRARINESLPASAKAVGRVFGRSGAERRRPTKRRWSTWHRCLPQSAMRRPGYSASRGSSDSR